MTIPRNPNRYHADHGLDQWRGDCPRAIVEASKLPIGRDGGRYIDINFQVCLTDDGTARDAVGLHSAKPKVNGFLYIKRKNSPLRRKMTVAELNRNVSNWHRSEVVRWRRTRFPGASYASRVRPYMFDELVAFAKGNARRHRVTICSELKSVLFARYPEIAVRMHGQVAALNSTVYPMTLVTMIGWRTKMKNFHDAGFETALLAHGAKKPADLAAWRPYISRVWGAWRR